MLQRSILLLAACALVGACEAKVGKPADGKAAKGDESAAAPAEGKSKEGEFSIKAPGFDMKIDIPAGVTSRGESDSDLLYPGSTLSGMHVEAGKDSAKGKGSGGVELRFTTADSADKVAAWYRDPARASGFSIVGQRQEGGALVISGTEKDGGDPFTLRLSPRGGGGTEGRLTLTDRG